MPRAGPAAGQATPKTVEERLRSAVVELVIELGYSATSIEAICERADVPVLEFQRVYQDKERAFLAIFEELSDDLIRQCKAAYAAAGEEWLPGLRATAYAAARWIRDHPNEARFTVLEGLAAGEEARLLRERTMNYFVDLVDQGRTRNAATSPPSRTFASAAVGGVLELLVRRFVQGQGVARAEEMVPELMYLAVQPYVGAAKASEELTHPPPEESSGQSRT